MDSIETKSNETELSKAIRVLTKYLTIDKGYRQGWVSNIATCFQSYYPDGDYSTIRKTSNDAANDFINLLCKGTFVYEMDKKSCACTLKMPYPIEEPEKAVNFKDEFYYIDREESGSEIVWYGINTNWTNKKDQGWMVLEGDKWAPCKAPIYEKIYEKINENC